MKIQQSGFNLATFKTKDSNEFMFNKFACYDDGSFVLISNNNESESHTDVLFFKPIFHGFEKPTFKFVKGIEACMDSNVRSLVCFKTITHVCVQLRTVLLIGSNGHIYVLQGNERDGNAFLEIKGNFDYAHICDIYERQKRKNYDEDYERFIEIIGFCKGQLKFYKIILNRDKYEVLNLKNVFAHFDYTTFMFQKGVILFKYILIVNMLQKIKFQFYIKIKRY